MIKGQLHPKTTYSLFLLVLALLLSGASSAQTFVEELRKKDEQRKTELRSYQPFVQAKDQQRFRNEGIRGDKQYLDLSTQFNKEILSRKNERLQIKFPLNDKENINLNLKEVNFLTPDFILTNAKDEIISDPSQGKFYWGYVEEYPHSTVIFNVFSNEVSGTLDIKGRAYTLTKIKDSKEHILYEEKDLVEQPQLECFADDVKENNNVSTELSNSRNFRNVDNCVRMYIEIDHNLYLSKGSVAATYNYFTGAFSQVAILYANEDIEITLNQVKVWDEVDPYTGPNSGNYLNQFQAAVGPNFNGTLAHLVGTNGGGGIAYVGVVCNKANGFGYSGINSSYNNVPTYSWTVNVLTHEIGHNLGSPHTHACAWNGNNTQIDDCGNRYLANDNDPDTNPGDCYDANSEIIPSNGGTIMSYCHLYNNIGMNFNLGFGQQPGDLIRDRVHNANCLSVCEDCPNVGTACDDGDPCTTDDAIDSYCNCTGIPSPDNDGDGVCATQDPDDDDICVPNECADCTITEVTILLDNWPAETSWEIEDANGTIVASKNNYSGAGSTVTVEVCLEDGCFDFIIYDSYGDGICCGYGNGSYTVTDADNNVIASGGQFGSSETTNFCYSNYTECADLDEDDICDDVDPCYDPMIMEISDALASGAYDARQEIILNIGTTIPENAVIELNAPSFKIMDNVTIPESATIILNETPCQN